MVAKALCIISEKPEKPTKLTGFAVSEATRIVIPDRQRIYYPCRQDNPYRKGGGSRERNKNKAVKSQKLQEAAWEEERSQQPICCRQKTYLTNPIKQNMPAPLPAAHSRSVSLICCNKSEKPKSHKSKTNTKTKRINNEPIENKQRTNREQTEKNRENREQTDTHPACNRNCSCQYRREISHGRMNDLLMAVRQ